jgi:hypothetical protein
VAEAPRPGASFEGGGLPRLFFPPPPAGLAIFSHNAILSPLSLFIGGHFRPPTANNDTTENHGGWG